eukprot:GEMP01038220.1.p1 GENE.GEMP01038220.1~~GEMP01038220.1.p1  ORF type:complete len:400 (+),score=74.88 GEMP01038220.1:40-1239(+)
MVKLPAKNQMNRCPREGTVSPFPRELWEQVGVFLPARSLCSLSVASRGLVPDHCWQYLCGTVSPSRRKSFRAQFLDVQRDRCGSVATSLAKGPRLKHGNYLLGKLRNTKLEFSLKVSGRELPFREVVYGDGDQSVCLKCSFASFTPAMDALEAGALSVSSIQMGKNVLIDVPKQWKVVVRKACGQGGELLIADGWIVQCDDEKVYSLGIQLHMWTLWERLAFGTQWYSSLARRARARRRDDCDSHKGLHDYTVFWVLRGWNRVFARDVHRKVDMLYIDEEWATAVLMDPEGPSVDLELPQLEWRNLAFQCVHKGLGFLDLLVLDEFMDCVCATSKTVALTRGWHPFFADACAGDWDIEQEQQIVVEEGDFEFCIVLSKKRINGALLRWKTPQLNDYWGR